jgi:hypothetical protein
LKKVLNIASQKASFTKFGVILQFLKVFKTDFFFPPEFLKKFQNSEYEVHQVGLNEDCSKNFSILALNMAELAAPQILFKNPRQRRVKDGKKIFALNSFFRYKKS